MELQGSVTIPAAPQQVWQALNDPEILRRCIPGCEEVRQISPQEMHARVMLKLGPVRANFVGKVLLTDVRPLLGCTLNFEGSGGSAGFAKGHSVISLTTVAEGTRLDYTAQASVAGKLGQIGGRLMDASARQLADRFFAAFKAQLSGEPSAERQIAIAQAGPAGAEPAMAPAANFPIVARSSTAQDSSGESWLDKEKPRLLWFAAGVLATSIGVWMGAHWLR
jgi:carbon monoxide dehydrogenase subunit G